MNKEFQVFLSLLNIGVWFRLGIQSAFLRRVNLHDLNVKPSPLSIFLLIAISLLINIGLEFLMIKGHANFYLPAINWGWLMTLLSLGLCWYVSRLARRNGFEMNTAALFAVTITQEVVFNIIGTLAYFVSIKLGFKDSETVQWGWYYVVAVWAVLGFWLLLSRAAKSGLRTILWTGFCSFAIAFYSYSVQPPWFWYADRLTEQQDDISSYELSQSQIEQQLALSDEQRKNVAIGRKGVTELYTIEFSPYGNEDVFMNDSMMVSDLMAKRFDAANRTQLLVNNPKTHATLPWATNINLERAIQEVAAKMNKDEDILMIYLNSHGGKDMKLSASNWPIAVEPLTPMQLNKWLDNAGIKYRVIAISACYSGSWIGPLQDENSLIMTAADKDHTSYGCGSRSTLTYFGRAMFDEALRQTYSFEEAFKMAVPVIKQREIDAKKEDGFSNPQIYIGKNIHEKLVALEQQLSQQNSTH
jgi:hypothetical protein